MKTILTVCDIEYFMNWQLLRSRQKEKERITITTVMAGVSTSATKYRTLIMKTRQRGGW